MRKICYKPPYGEVVVVVVVVVVVFQAREPFKNLYQNQALLVVLNHERRLWDGGDLREKYASIHTMPPNDS